MNNKYVKKYKNIYINIGQNVKKFREEKGWIQKDLADRCEGVTREKVSKIENAYQDYMFSTLLEVCSALNKTLDEISESNEDT